MGGILAKVATPPRYNRAMPALRSGSPARWADASRRFCAATGRSGRCWCAPRCPGSAVASRRTACSRWPGTTTSIRASSCTIAALVHAVRTFPPIALARFAAPRLDAAGAWRQPDERRGRRVAATLRVHPLRAPRRSHGELRGARRRRRRPFRFLRRVPAAGRRSSPLARQRSARSVAAARLAAQDPGALPAERGMHSSTRATCSTCRPTTRMKASRSMTCTTYSIGFRAPSAQELGTAFLDWLRDSIDADGRVRRPRPCTGARTCSHRRVACSHAAPPCSTRYTGTARRSLRFVGCHLTEPRPTVVFDPPMRALAPARFARAGVATRRTLGPAHANPIRWRTLYVNGEAIRWPRANAAPLKRLANARCLAGSDVRGAQLLRLLHRWYHDGYIDFDRP